MTEEQLEKAKILKDNIAITKNAIDKVTFLLDEKEENRKDNEIDDGYYPLYISRHGDRSGHVIELCRYLGNRNLLEAILNTLKYQLEEQEGMFNNL